MVFDPLDLWYNNRITSPLSHASTGHESRAPTQVPDVRLTQTEEENDARRLQDAKTPPATSHGDTDAQVAEEAEATAKTDVHNSAHDAADARENAAAKNLYKEDNNSLRQLSGIHHHSESQARWETSL